MLQPSLLIHSYKYSFFIFLFFLGIEAIECYSNLTTSTIAINKQIKHPPVEITRDHSIIRTSDFWHIRPSPSSSSSPPPPPPLLSSSPILTDKFTTPSMKNPTSTSDQPTSENAPSGVIPSDQNVQDTPLDDLTQILSTPSLETPVSTLASSILTTIQWIEQLDKTLDSISQRSTVKVSSQSSDSKSLSFSHSTLVSILANTTRKPTHNVSNMQTSHPATATGKWPHLENSPPKRNFSVTPKVYQLTVAVTSSGVTSDTTKFNLAPNKTQTTRSKHTSSSSTSRATIDTTMALNITQTHNGSGQAVITSHNVSQVSVTNPNPGSILDSFTTSETPSTGAERHAITNSSRTLSTLTTLSSDSASASSNYTSDSISGNHTADTFLTTPQIIGISFGAVVVILGISIPLICWMHKKYINRVSKHYKEYWDDNVNLSYINGHLDAPREQNDDVISLDNDSFLNSLDSASFTNLWPSSDNSRRTNL